jgi:NADPH:quinone reductase-like Zn-dependent oxidoreductase
MRAVVIQRQGTPVAANVAFVKDWPDPAPPGPGQVLIKTIASAFNHMDLWVGRGIGGLTLTYPRISGCDACGTVESVGEGVDKAWLGRRVIVNAATRVAPRSHPDDPPASTLAPAYELIGEHTNGMFCERFLAPAANLAAVDNANPQEAAAFGLCALTAYSMMLTKGQLRPGQTVLITGIGGGVATSALALAKHWGCRTAVTSRHQWKLDKAKDLGADFLVLDKGQDWSKEVRAWTNKRGTDLAVDSVGKAAHLNCIKSLARGGAFLTPGATTGADAITDLTRVFWNQLRILGSTMGSNEEFSEVAALFRCGKLRPAIDKVFPAEEGPEAYARLEAGEQFGKIVLNW